MSNNLLWETIYYFLIVTKGLMFGKTILCHNVGNVF